MAEVLFGIELLPKGKQRDQLLDEAGATFAEDFARRVLPFDEQAARMFALIAATRRTSGVQTSAKASANSTAPADRM